MKKYILGLLSGIIVAGVIGVSASILYQASEIGFTPKNKNWKVNNLESALNDLHRNRSNSYSKFVNNAYWNFSYIGEQEQFSVPVSGTYKLEVWGAQGGSTDTAIGGFGGYSVGTIHLDKDETLYVNVGGKGSTTTSKSSDYTGGYNGGGNSYHWKNNDLFATSGGGATHIAKVSGTLDQLEQYKGEYSSERKTYNSDKILIVAGGGGGSAKAGTGTLVVIGGSAGGFKGSDGAMNPVAHDGYYGLGGSQTTGGESVQSTTYNSYGKAENGSFGKGGNSSLTSNNGGGSGGGAGFYGGGGSTTSDSPGGGSGYIGSSLLTNKHMTCYDCEISSDEHIKTQRVADSTKKSEKPKADNVKIGNGAARITYIGN